MAIHLVEPHGGTLVDLIVDAGRAARLKEQSRHWASWDLTARQVCDLELLMNGGFSPLKGFLDKADYESVCENSRLADGTLWPIPVVLDVSEQVARGLEPGGKLALRDAEGNMLGVLTVEDIWQADLQTGGTNQWCLGGPVEGLQPPKHYDFVRWRLTPAQVRAELARLGRPKVVASQPQGPIHRADRDFMLSVAADLEAGLLIHPAVGAIAVGDADHYTRVRCYLAALSHYPTGTAVMSLLPLAPRPDGPREALFQAIVHKNHGCTHVIAPPDAAETIRPHEAELGVQAVTLQTMLYLPDRDACTPAGDVPAGAAALSISDAQLRQRLDAGGEIPPWFSFPEVVAELRRSRPPRSSQGFTVFFTGLSGSGKSTIANVLAARLLEMGHRPVTLWDGDIVRTNLSSELGFSKEHRDVNIRRIGFVAAQDTKNGGIAICAPIAPYDAIRKENRELISAHGGYILVHVATSLAVCEQRDTKGLYAKARAGIIKDFTGISDPYEEPDDADIVLDTVDVTPEQCARQIILHLEKEGYLGADET